MSRQVGRSARRPLLMGARHENLGEVMLFLRVFFVATALVVGPEVTAAAEREMPSFDITATCRGSGQVQTAAKCMQDEQAARDQLAKLWPQFKQSDALRCVQIVTTGGAFRTSPVDCEMNARFIEGASTAA